MAVRLLDLALFRVGSESYTRDNGSFGLATVRRDHVRTSGDLVRFDYRAKSGQRRIQEVADAEIAPIVRTLKRRHDGNPELLAYRNGSGWRDVRSEDVNAYVKELAGDGFTAKDFRTWHGTVFAAVALAAGGEVPAAQAARRRRITAAVKEVAAELGNTPAVARASYVDPRLLDRYEEGVTITPRLAETGRRRSRRSRVPRRGRGRRPRAPGERFPPARRRLSAPFARLAEREQQSLRRGWRSAGCACPRPRSKSPRPTTVTCSCACSTRHWTRSTDAEIPFLLIGGIGSAVYGRDQGTRDIDVFVRPETARKVLDVLRERGFETKEVAERWLSKAIKHGVLVDVIFRSSRDILLGDEMFERAEVMPFRGRMVRIAPPEDLIVMKACAMSEDTSRYWYDAVSIIAHTELDWDYLVERARQHGARRMLSLLLFATSLDIVVPSEPIETLHDAIGTGRPA